MTKTPTNTMIRELNLPEMRKERRQSQQELAGKLSVNQAEISKMERRDDMYVSTLQNFVIAMGGSLEMFAIFPDTNPIRIMQFKNSKSEELQRNTIAAAENSKEELRIKTVTPKSDLDNLWLWSIGGPRDLNIEPTAEALTTQPQIEEDWFQKLVYQPLLANEHSGRTSGDI